MAVHSYLAGVLLVRVKAYFLPCSPADRSDIRVTKAFCHQSKMTARFPPALYVGCVASRKRLAGQEIARGVSIKESEG